MKKGIGQVEDVSFFAINWLRLLQPDLQEALMISFGNQLLVNKVL